VVYTYAFRVATADVENEISAENFARRMPNEVGTIAVNESYLP
jgi:hypothetical protein